ncbi:PAP2 superfamily protein [Planctomycetes bacterium K23_9]|uniref:PAP2 superfamily protein n=2 Tax=Stieleria marina TaxID=1930275 RepID=A0A517NT43_9BACT|nr:PAP2 superfamily protein [Planctomycetes bacterium K23_9]
MSIEYNKRSRPTFSMFGVKPTNAGTLYRTGTLLWLAGIAMLSVPMVTLVDVPIARWFESEPMSSKFGDALDLMQLFSHGWGIFLVLLAIALMAPQHRWYVPRLGAMAMGGGAVATLAKMFVLRPRPNGLNLEIASYDSAWLWAFDWNLEQVAAFDASTRAFPSGNMATAIAFSVGLWVLFPRGRWLFAVVCFGAMFQRLFTGSHFLSDLFGGAAFGLLWAYTCLHPSLLGSLFDKIEPEKNSQAPVLQVSSTPVVSISIAQKPVAAESQMETATTSIDHVTDPPAERSAA